MMRPTLGELLARLRGESLVTTQDVEAVHTAMMRSDEDDVPTYLRIITGAGGWLATAMVFGFFASLDILNDAASAAVAGGLLVGITIALRHRVHGHFARHAAIAVSFAGQGLLLFGIQDVTHSAAGTWTIGAALSIALIMLIPDALHRFLSTLVAVGASAYVGYRSGLAAYLDVTTLLVVIGCGIWRLDRRRLSADMDAALAPVGYALLVALFVICLVGTFSARVLDMHDRSLLLDVSTTIGIAMLLVLLVYLILGEHGTPRGGKLAILLYAAIMLLAVATLHSPGIMAGVAVLVLGFDRRNAFIIELAVAFLIVFGAAYYYSLELTLLQKSGVLMATGALCFAVRTVLGTPAASPAEVVA